MGNYLFGVIIIVIMLAVVISFSDKTKSQRAFLSIFSLVIVIIQLILSASLSPKVIELKI